MNVSRRCEDKRINLLADARNNRQKSPAAIAMETLSVISTFVEDNKASLNKMFCMGHKKCSCLSVCFSFCIFFSNFFQKDLHFKKSELKMYVVKGPNRLYWSPRGRRVSHLEMNLESPSQVSDEAHW